MTTFLVNLRTTVKRQQGKSLSLGIAGIIFAAGCGRHPTHSDDEEGVLEVRQAVAMPMAEPFNAGSWTTAWAPSTYRKMRSPRCWPY
jgi:hypothetical protein